jgi:inhibitor of KinA sporulation pathway (predicted exonuclease)
MIKQPPDVFTAIDLEMAQPSNKIIQIGAVVGRLSTGEILDKLSIFVNPNEQLSEYISKLTHITQADVDGGIQLPEAFARLEEFHKKHESFINPITWGQGDVKALLEQMVEYNVEFNKSLFGRRIIDVKNTYVDRRLANKEFPTGGLKKAMNRFGLKFKGIAHSADDDAENTFILYTNMIQLLKGNK